MPRSVCVFCSSSSKVDGVYVELARDLGARLGRRGDTLVYGGTDTGLMGVLASAARDHGAHVIGVIPQRMVEHGIADERCDELVVTPDMRQRKTIMEQRADAFIALPGGFGTLEEFAEILALGVLDYHAKPLVLLNAGGFYDGLLAFFEQLYAGGFARSRYRGLYDVVPDAVSALARIDREGG